MLGPIVLVSEAVAAAHQSTVILWFLTATAVPVCCMTSDQPCVYQSVHKDF